jgi:hypothetical protein
MSKHDWGSVLLDALNESSSLKGAIMGGVCKHLARSAVDSFLSDVNTFMSTSDAIEIATSAAGTDYIDEMGGIAELTQPDDSLIDVIDRVASGTAYRLVADATEAELVDLLATLDDVETDGYEVWNMGTGSSNLGWLPHQTETDAYGGSLCFWSRPEGGHDAWELHLTIGNTRVWFGLKKDDTDD